MEDTVVLTMSEFGRAVKENGNRGTDHGHGNAMMVIGGDVRGGRVYGRWPGLDVEQRYDGRDLAVTTDFRDVFGEIVTRHLGVADPGADFSRLCCQPFAASRAVRLAETSPNWTQRPRRPQSKTVHFFASTLRACLRSIR